MTISVIGLGKLGRPISEVFKKNGYRVIGIDIGDSYGVLGDITFVIVPTPSEKNNKFTSCYVDDVLNQIKQNQIVAIVSTIMPGETDRLQKNYPHLTLLYNPSFVALGSVAYDFTHPDFVFIGGYSEPAIKSLKSIYRKILKTKPQFAILTPLEAEIAKLALNCYITAKITFANQIGNLCYRLGIASDNVLGAIGKDSRIGSKYFKAGLGYGGPCFPRDNLALSEYFWDKSITPTLFKTIHSLNGNQVYEIIQRIEELHPKTVGFSGLSYKEGTDVEEWSQLKMIYDKLKALGYDVRIGKGDVNLDWEGICQE